MTWYYGKSLSDATQYGFYTVDTECTDPVEVSDADYATLMAGCTCNKHIEPNGVGYPVLVNGGYVEDVPSEVFYKNVENPLAEATDECTIQKGQYDALAGRSELIGIAINSTIGGNTVACTIGYSRQGWTGTSAALNSPGSDAFTVFGDKIASACNFPIVEGDITSQNVNFIKLTTACNVSGTVLTCPPLLASLLRQLTSDILVNGTLYLFDSRGYTYKTASGVVRASTDGTLTVVSGTFNIGEFDNVSSVPSTEVQTSGKLYFHPN